MQASLRDFMRISIHALREEGDDAVSRSSMRVYHFYPRPPRGGRPRDACTYCRALLISIHALREEGDTEDFQSGWCFVISIHALREEGDGGVAAVFRSFAYFYPRPPRGGRHPPFAHRIHTDTISIHALREEGDLPAWCPGQG